jgi:hypothetical protein
MKISKIRSFLAHNWIWLAVLFLLATITILPRSPLVFLTPKRDSAVFAYIGERILNGDIPYLDVWDHKGPVTYFINALALLIIPNSFWGIWLLQWLMLFASVALGFVALSMFFQKSSAFVGLLTAFTYYLIYRGGENFTEEHAMLPMFAAMFLYAHLLKQGKGRLHHFLIGILFAISFLTRANHIGLFVAIVVIELVRFFHSRQWKEGKEALIKLVAGFLLVNLAFLTYFAYNNALAAYIDAAFAYNFLYASQAFSFSVWWSSNALELRNIALPLTALFIIFLISFVRSSDDWSAKKYFYLFAGLVLPIEFLLSNMSAFGYDHYFLILLPGIALLVAYCYELLLDWIKQFLAGRNIANSKWVTILALATFFLAFFIPRWQERIETSFSILASLSPGNNNAPVLERKADPHIQELRDFLQKNPEIDANPYLLIWSNGVIYNLAVDKPAPTKFVYQYPLNSDGYVSEAMVAEFVEAMQNYQPIIMDMSASIEKFPEIGNSYWQDISVMQLASDYILDNYLQIKKIGPNEYPLYIHK